MIGVHSAMIGFFRKYSGILGDIRKHSDYFVDRLEIVRVRSGIIGHHRLFSEIFGNAQQGPGTRVNAFSKSKFKEQVLL